MKSNRIPFGFSTCFTTANCDSVLSEEFIDLMIDKGAYFSWYFTFMPIGCKTDTSLMANPDQREKLYRTIRSWRSTKSIFNIDFWHEMLNMLEVALLEEEDIATLMQMEM